MGLKKKIIFMVESLSSGGAEKQLFLLLKNINKELFEVWLITWHKINFYKKEQLPDVHWINIPRKSKLDIRPILMAWNIVVKNKVNIIQGFLDTGNLYATIVGKFSPAIAVCSERSSQRKLKGFQFLHKKWAHKNSRLTITNSNVGKEFLINLEINADKIEIIRNGFELSKLFNEISMSKKNELRLKFNIPIQKKLILNAGRITELKNQELLIEALGKTNNSDNYVIIFLGSGKGNYFTYLKNKVVELGMEEKVVFRNASQDIIDYYKVSDLFVFTSNYEGSPNVPVEAMASGIPVISTNVGDIEYYFEGSSNVLIPPNNVLQLAIEIEKIFKNSNEDNIKNYLINKKLLISRKTDVSNMVSNYEETYLNLIN